MDKAYLFHIMFIFTLLIIGLHFHVFFSLNVFVDDTQVFVSCADACEIEAWVM